MKHQLATAVIEAMADALPQCETWQEAFIAFGMAAQGFSGEVEDDMHEGDPGTHGTIIGGYALMMLRLYECSDDEALGMVATIRQTGSEEQAKASA